MRFISLFAGVGGFDLGMERAGHECVAQVEWDRNAAGVLKRRWPDVPLFCDVSKVSADDLPDCDFITYGFPCQDLSVAGKREGLDGKRSGLFYEATRLIRGLLARGGGLRFAIAENVAGLFSADDGLAFARCLRELLDCGACEVGWRIFDSQYFGVAQRRKRVFIVADFGGESCDQVLAVSESLRGYPAPSRETGQSSPADAGGGFTPGSFGGYEPGVGTLRSQGGDLGGGSETLTIAETDVVGALSDGAHMGGGLNGQDAYTGRIMAVQGCDVFNGEETGDTAATVTSATGISNASGPKVCSWNGDETPKSSEDVCLTLRAGQGGEGVGVAHVSHGQAKECENVVPPLMAHSGPNRHGEGSVSTTEFTAVTSNLTVRRLTPRECERLQGFPDDWTKYRQMVELEGNEWARVELMQKQADGPRYKQMGNAVTVNVAEWLGRRLADV